MLRLAPDEMVFLRAFALFALVSSSAIALPLATREGSQPTVTLDEATIYGRTNGTVTQYLGLPYAQPPYVVTLSVLLRPSC